MKKLVTLLLLFGGLCLVGPATSSAARARTDSEDFIRNRSVSPVRPQPQGTSSWLPKASCRSDSGDVCICGPGQKCTATATSCSCGKPSV
jgi:hypothetical protein